MHITKELFKQTMSRWASGITIVTTRRGEGLNAMTATAFSSISAEPPLVMVAINKHNHTHALIEEQRAFGIMILKNGQEEISNGGAGFRGAEGHFLLGTPFRVERTGAPILIDCLAWLDCALYASYDGGDHTIYLGKVEATGTNEGEPLLWYGRGYQTSKFNENK